MSQGRCDLKDNAIAILELCTATFDSTLHSSRCEVGENAYCCESFGPSGNSRKAVMESQ